eukprot:TRINITY_DN20898_c0_g1_i1.p1 TRINITY_DN20898_c0_g1~~TRINITY_DN20898_c0_g1_i1.p1  ORF type:complete len:570 (+),score=121.81 TRINITY_DN20898_c0_g1_i1:233-1942(+)
MRSTIRLARGQGRCVRRLQCIRLRSNLASLLPETHECITGSAYTVNGDSSTEAWRAWVFDEKGNFTDENLTLRDLHNQANLVARDLLTLTADPNSRVDEGNDHDKTRPVVVPKNSAVLLSLSHIKVAITHNRMVLFDVHRPVVQYFGLGFSEYLKNLVVSEVKHLATADRHPDTEQLASAHDIDGDGTLDDLELARFMTTPLFDRADGEAHSVPFECKALDGILSAVGTKYAHRLSVLVPTVSTVLDKLEESSIQSHVKLSPSVLQEVLTLKNALDVLESSIDSMSLVIKGLLENDDDMIELLLSEKQARGGTTPPVDEHDEVELLLETHLREFSTLGREAMVLRRRIMATQEIVNINMDNYRNRIIRVNVGISILSLGCASSVIGASFAGMNLISGLEEHPSMFWWTCAGCLGLGATMAMVPMIRLSKAIDSDGGHRMIEPKVLEPLFSNSESDMQDIVMAQMRIRDNKSLNLDEFAEMMSIATGRTLKYLDVAQVFDVFAGTKGTWKQRQIDQAGIYRLLSHQQGFRGTFNRFSLKNTIPMNKAEELRKRFPSRHGGPKACPTPLSR